jgi:aryl-alcohol dehydrogenase-like predicted oxidoreductase
MTVERIALRPGFEISRIAKGNWQIADDHSGLKIDTTQAVKHMFPFAEAGINAFVCGDIYAGVEARIGEFLKQYANRYGAERASDIKVLTTHVPAFLDEDGLRNWSKSDSLQVVDRSLKRLGRERLDLVQMHWWNYDIPGNVEMALTLKELQQQGKIDQIGATNYDVSHLKEMVDAGVDIVSNTVQYSLLDRRPEHGLADFCAEHDCKILAYGSLGGGFFSDTWMGIPDPGKPAFENVSLDKYYRIICDFGGWQLFQKLLQALKKIARKHSVSMANVAVRYVLERDQVASVVVGARNTKHLQANLRVFDFQLDDQDYELINAVLQASSGPQGDCYEIDRKENRDALEEVKTEYFDVEDGKLVTKSRDPVVLTGDLAYGHHLKSH